MNPMMPAPMDPMALLMQARQQGAPQQSGGMGGMGGILAGLGGGGMDLLKQLRGNPGAPQSLLPQGAGLGGGNLDLSALSPQIRAALMAGLGGGGGMALPGLY